MQQLEDFIRDACKAEPPANPYLDGGDDAFSYGSNSGPSQVFNNNGQSA